MRGLLFLLLVFSSTLYAADYKYYEFRPGWNGVHYKSKEAACSFPYSNDSVWSFDYARSDGRCIARLSNGGEGSHYFWVERIVSCPAGHVYNYEAKRCEPEVDCSNVSPGIFKTPDGPVHTVNGRRIVASRLEGPVCYNSCEYDITKTVSCYLVPGSTDTGFCNALGQGNGNNCSTPDAALGGTGDQLNPPPETPDPDEPPSDPNDPGCHGIPGYVWNGTTCVKAPPGDGDGGGDNGGDGGDNGGNNGGNDGGGNNGGGDGGGDNGGNNGGGDGSGNGDGDGDGDSGGSTGGGNGNGNGSGNGNGDGDGEGDGEDGGGAGVANCPDNRCSFSDDNMGRAEMSYESNSKAFTHESEGAFYIPDQLPTMQEVFAKSPLGKELAKIKLPQGGGVCPVANLQLLGTSISFDAHCTLFDQIRGILSAVMLAAWALLAVRILLSA